MTIIGHCRPYHPPNLTSKESPHKKQSHQARFKLAYTHVSQNPPLGNATYR